MRLAEIEKKAKLLGIRDTWRFSKKELIRNIQRTEGNNDCFATPSRLSCAEWHCCWRGECVK